MAVLGDPFHERPPDPFVPSQHPFLSSRMAQVTGRTGQRLCGHDPGKSRSNGKKLSKYPFQQVKQKRHGTLIKSDGRDKFEKAQDESRYRRVRSTSVVICG